MLSGEVVGVVGPVVDVHFDQGGIPPIHSGIKIYCPKGPASGEEREIVAEVAQHIGDDLVRAVALPPTDGLRRGLRVSSNGVPVEVRVGADTLGRVFNVVGEAIDGGPRLKTKERMAIHRKPPTFEELETSPQILETGIKVIDLLAPYPRGGKVGLFGGAGVDRKSTRLNSSHVRISYAVFC